MKLYILRHATAKDLGNGILTDESRPLSDQGNREALNLAAYLKARNTEIDLIVHSPLTRTTQTAEHVAASLSVKSQASDKLSTAGDLHTHIQVLDEFKSLAKLLIVGHQPVLAQFIFKLVGADRKIGLTYPPCSLAVMDVEHHAYGWGGLLGSLLLPTDL